MYKWIPFLLVIVLSAALALDLVSPKNPDESTAGFIQYDISPFDVPVLGDDGQRLTPQLWKDKIVVVNVFASWCEPCAVEHPVLMELGQGGKVELIGLAWKDKPQNIADWLKKRGNPYRLVGVDEKGESTMPLGVSGVPETFVIQDSKVVFRYKSQLTHAVIEQDILPLVERLQDE